jgi:hypothetical protein
LQSFRSHCNQAEAWLQDYVGATIGAVLSKPL